MLEDQILQVSVRGLELLKRSTDKKICGPDITVQQSRLQYKPFVQILLNRAQGQTKDQRQKTINTLLYLNQVHEAFNAQHITRELFQQFEGEGAPDVSQVPEAFLVVRMQVYS